MWVKDANGFMTRWGSKHKYSIACLVTDAHHKCRRCSCSCHPWIVRQWVRLSIWWLGL